MLSDGGESFRIVCSDIPIISNLFFNKDKMCLRSSICVNSKKRCLHGTRQKLQGISIFAEFNFNFIVL